MPDGFIDEDVRSTANLISYVSTEPNIVPVNIVPSLNSSIATVTVLLTFLSEGLETSAAFASVPNTCTQK